VCPQTKAEERSEKGIMTQNPINPNDYFPVVRIIGINTKPKVEILLGESRKVIELLFCDIFNRRTDVSHPLPKDNWMRV